MLLRRLSNPGTAGLIFRRVYDDLKRNHIDKFFEEFPHLLKYYRATDHEVVLPPVPPHPPARIVFGYAETEAEVRRKFHGVEYMDMFVDQAEQLSETEVKVMRTACRWPGTTRYQCKMVLFFNPGGIGIQYLKRIFHDRHFRDLERGEDYRFIQAYGWDNVEWARSALVEMGLDEETYYSWDDQTRYNFFITQTQYGQELNSLPQALRVGYLMGSFDVFAGQYFQFAPAAYTVAPPVIQPWYPKWISIDWGFSHDAAIYWWAQDNHTTYTYRELVISGRGPRALAQEIIDRTSLFNGEEVKGIDAIYVSPDATHRRNIGDTILDQLAQVFTAAGFPRPRVAEDDRVSGFMLMHEMIEHNTWKISAACPKLLENLPLFSRDEDEPEDCFVAGTLVNTKRGLVPIELITTSDLVLTREGYKQVIWSDKVRKSRVYRLISSGREIIGTSQHPIWTDNRGWVPLTKLDGYDILPVWRLSHLTGFGSIVEKEENTSAAISMIDLMELRTFIERFGNFIMDQFQMGMRSITKLDSRMLSTILSVFQYQSIDLCTPEGPFLLQEEFNYVPIGQKNFGNQDHTEKLYVKDVESLLQPGVVRKFYGVQLDAITNGVENRLRNDPVNTVEKSLTLGWQNTERIRDQLDSAHKDVLILEPGGIEWTYNLQVKDCQEFFANGILVHNCVKFSGDDPGDSARYGLRSRFNPREAPKEVQLATALESIKIKYSDKGAQFTAIHFEHLKFMKEWAQKHTPVRRIRNWRQRV